MSKYNHMLDMAFTVVSETEDGSDITPAQIQQGILLRLIGLIEEGSWEIGGAIGLCDTYNEENKDE